jgi:hypothetical protein
MTCLLSIQMYRCDAFSFQFLLHFFLGSFPFYLANIIFRSGSMPFSERDSHMGMVRDGRPAPQVIGAKDFQNILSTQNDATIF